MEEDSGGEDGADHRSRPLPAARIRLSRPVLPRRRHAQAVAVAVDLAVALAVALAVVLAVRRGRLRMPAARSHQRISPPPAGARARPAPTRPPRPGRAAAALPPPPPPDPRTAATAASSAARSDRRPRRPRTPRRPLETSPAVSSSYSIACQSAELFQAGEEDAYDWDDATGRPACVPGQVGVRCSHCADAPWAAGAALAHGARAYPASVGGVGPAARKIAESHLHRCASAPDAVRAAARDAAAAEAGVGPDGRDAEWRRIVLLEFCVDRCRRLDVVNRRVARSGLEYGPNQTAEERMPMHGGGEGGGEGVKEQPEGARMPEGAGADALASLAGGMSGGGPEGGSIMALTPVTTKRDRQAQAQASQHHRMEEDDRRGSDAHNPHHPGQQQQQQQQHQQQQHQHQQQQQQHLSYDPAHHAYAGGDEPDPGQTRPFEGAAPSQQQHQQHQQHQQMMMHQDGHGRSQSDAIQGQALFGPHPTVGTPGQHPMQPGVGVGGHAPLPQPPPAPTGPSGPPPIQALGGGPGSPDFPFFHDGYGAWVCRYCCHLPYPYRPPGSVFQAPPHVPPEFALVDQHVRQCRGEYGGAGPGFRVAPPGGPMGAAGPPPPRISPMPPGMGYPPLPGQGGYPPPPAPPGQGGPHPQGLYGPGPPGQQHPHQGGPPPGWGAPGQHQLGGGAPPGMPPPERGGQGLGQSPSRYGPGGGVGAGPEQEGPGGLGPQGGGGLRWRTVPAPAVAVRRAAPVSYDDAGTGTGV